jgi:diguanylate cyclase (GGDEF)-like protein
MKIFSDIYDTLPVPIVVCRNAPGLPIAYVNAVAKQLFAPIQTPGETPGGDAARGLSAYCRFHNPDQYRAFESVLKSDGAVESCDAVLHSAQGEGTLFRLRANVIRVAGGDYAVVYFGSAPAQRATGNDTAIMRGQEIFRTVADNLDELVYISDLETYELKYVSKSLASAMRREPNSVVGQPCWAVLHRGQTGPCPFCPLPNIRGNKPSDASYIWELHSSISGKWYMVKNSVIGWVDGGRAHLSMLVDITYRKQYEEQLKRFAATDAMTDVYNRKWGYARLEKLFQADTKLRAEQTLCFIDIDNLKKINDRLGHAVGDEVIVNIIRIILGNIRKDDFIVRWGGDEFIIFLNCGLRDAVAALSKIRFGLDHFNNSQGKAYALSISIGLTGFAEPFMTLDELIRETDRRMYLDKMECRRRKEAAGPLDL